ncbi:MAG: LemA family protein [Luteimonas sp.]
MTDTVIVVLLLAALLAWAFVVFNRPVRLRNQARTAWADIHVQLTRRHDLVPQLVSAVQAYAGHERATIDAVPALRTRTMDTAGAATLSDLEQSLGDGIHRLIALQEARPALAASDNFAQLQTDLVDVEAQLQYARRFYDGAVRDLNDAVQRVPDTFVARLKGIGQASLLQTDDGNRQPVAVAVAQ